MAVSIECTEQTSSTLTVRLIGLNEAYAYDDRYIEWQYKRSATSNNWSICEETTPISAYAEVSDTYTITDLFPGTTYYIQAIIYFDSGATVPVDVVNFSTDAYYSVYCYMSSQNGASPNISKCTVSVPSWGIEETKAYNEDGDDLTVLNIPIGYDVEFNATPADGCVFTGWIYHIGSATATERNSPNNPLTIKNPQGDIHIRALAEPPIKSFQVIEPEIDDKTFKWKCTLSEVYKEPIEYRMMVKYNAGASYEIDSGIIPESGMADYESITVDKFGTYEFQLILIINGKEFVSGTRYRNIRPSPIETSDFNVVVNNGSFNIKANWNTNMIHEETTYYILLRKVNEDGTFNTVLESEPVTCSLSNNISIYAPSYGEYFISVAYRVDSVPAGNYRSENFVLVEGEPGIPSLWEWTSPMDEKLPVDENREVHPVTAEEWEAFIIKIKELKEYLEGYNMTFSDFPQKFSSVEPGTSFTPSIYNEVASALRSLSYSAGELFDINDINEDTVLESVLFTNLSGQFNYLISEI